MKALNNFLFVVSFLIASAVVIALSGCTRQEQKAPPVTHQPPPVQVPAAKPTGPVSVDFDQAPLSEVVQFVTAQTGKGFILNGAGDKTVSWIEYNIAKDKLIDSFSRALTSADLLLKPTTEEKTVYTIERAEDSKVPYRLNFATSSRGTFFLLGSTIYPKDSFPHQVRYDAGHWYAMVPKSTADQLAATGGTTHGKN